MSAQKEEIIRNYIDGYNQFDVNKMVSDFDEKIIFENISNGEVNLSLEGMEAFKEQAEMAKQYFSERKQTIKNVRHDGEESEVEIIYYGVLAIDLPNGMKKGEVLNLTGRSIFKFADNRVIALKDIS